MRILLTNDDGIHAPGLLALGRRLLADGHQLSIAAPLQQHSGSGTSLAGNLDNQFVPTEPLDLPELPGVEAVGVDAPPAMVALMVAHGLLACDAELLISGINPGHNVGRLIAHSGTIAAAQIAAAYGRPAFAVSCGAQVDAEFDATATFVGRALEVLLRLTGEGGVLNVNFPRCPLDEIRGARFASLAHPAAGDVALEREPGGFRLNVSRDRTTVDPGSDLALLHEDYVTLTRLAAAPHDPAVEQAAVEGLERLLSFSTARASDRPTER